MIKTFREKGGEELYWIENGKKLGLPKELWRIERRKLRLLDASYDINDLRIPPGNHLEKLQGDRAGQYSIRVNDRWRICFHWEKGDAFEVDIINYHHS